MYSRNWVEFEAVTELPERLETVLLFVSISQENAASQGGVATEDNNKTYINGGGNGSGINQQNFANVWQKVYSSRGRR
ncbi:MAG: hypothetical protein RMK01_13445 [Thermomicrobium sp.]|nr:hypothetical protein [Thermomicrobium sp.]